MTPRQVPVFAVQYTGENYSEIECNNIVWDKQYECPVLVGGAGEHVILENDWVVYPGTSGEPFLVLHDWLFQQMYEIPE